ncbi:UNVERIFIED_CONTAM: Venom protease [Trichonephila clavipes]
MVDVVVVVFFPKRRNESCQSLRQGDSGGPLFINQNDQMTVIGLVSAGIQCGSPLLPGIYTRVNSHLDWIEEQMKAS